MTVTYKMCVMVYAICTFIDWATAMNFQQAIETILTLTDGDSMRHDEVVLNHIVDNGTPAAIMIAENLMNNDFSEIDRISYIGAMAEAPNVWVNIYGKHAIIAFAKSLEVAFDSLEDEQSDKPEHDNIAEEWKANFDSSDQVWANNSPSTAAQYIINECLVKGLVKHVSFDSGAFSKHVIIFSDDSMIVFKSGDWVEKGFYCQTQNKLV